MAEYKERTVSYLGHDPQLFSSTIGENISLGDDIDFDEILKEVCLDEEIKEFDQGLDTVIGDHGVRMSGGQQERIALARALAHPAPIILLDDPFSAVDPQTEGKIIHDLRTKHKDSIILLISHRLAHFNELDQVIMLGHDRTYISTHEELLKSSDVYRQLYEVQKGAKQ